MVLILLHKGRMFFINAHLHLHTCMCTLCVSLLPNMKAKEKAKEGGIVIYFLEAQLSTSALSTSFSLRMEDSTKTS